VKSRAPGLGVDGDIIYDPSIYDAANRFEFDIPFYLKQARKADGAVLELCCGSGRITLPLAKEGIDITGIDFTASMLSRAREKAREQGLAVTLSNGDMRKVRLGKKFKLVFIPFNSLQNTYTLDDVEKVFATVRAHMAAGARFVFDIFNPDIGYMAGYQRLRKGAQKFRLDDGRKVVIDQLCRYDSANQVNRVLWTHHVGAARPLVRKLDMRCFYPLEMDALLKYNGFNILKKFGDFSGAPFTSKALKQIYICAVPGL
jgi:SAM-dependent methyltransferase